MSDAPPRKTYWVPIGIAIAAGTVLATGSCFGSLTSFSYPGALAKFFVVGFFVLSRLAANLAEIHHRGTQRQHRCKHGFR